MRAKNIKDRRTKRKLKKCKEITKTQIEKFRNHLINEEKSDATFENISGTFALLLLGFMEGKMIKRQCLNTMCI